MSKLKELIDKLCPNDVEYLKVDEICNNICSGGTPLSRISEYYGGNIPWLRTQEINFNDIYNTEIKITELGLENSSAKYIPKNCVIIAMYGATVGKVAINKIPLTTNQACCNLEINKDIALYKYIFYWLSNQYSYIKSLGQGSQTNINSKIVKQLIIPIPPLEIQEEIVHILDTFTELIECLTKELTLRKKQFDYYRDEFLTFGDDVPKVKLKDIAMIRARIGWQGLTKKEYLSNGDYQLITGTDFVNGKVDFSKCHFVSKERYIQDKNIQIKENDILVTKDGTLGKVAYINELIQPATLNSGIFVVRCTDEKILSKYLFYYLNSPKLMNFARSKLTGGTIKHLNQNVIVEFPICIPSLSEQNRIAEILDNFTELIETLEKEVTLRKDQYEYYRNKILTFKNV